MHPVVSAPAEAPAGNRRGSFAATPEGHSGASGTPGSSTGGSDNAVNGYGKDGTGSKVRNSGDLPSGLYVGNPPAKPSPVAGDPEPAKAPSQVNSNVVASVAPPRVASEGPLQPGNPAKLTETERAIFADRKFYSLTLNMPNLNSGGGSWVIRFAELKRDGPAHGADTSTDLSGPRATRKVDPAYPMQLMHQNVAGTVLLYAVIHADGTVGNVRILRSVDERLDRFAAEAVSQWKFDPATKNGTPVDVEATFQIPFKPARAGSSF
jgi:TonB family protein